LISICVPTYQRAALLSRLFKSIGFGSPGLEAVDEGVELVIVDDGSTDGTREIVESWRDRYGAAVKYSWQENAGRATALRRAISNAAGKYVIPMDSDDYFLPGWHGVVMQGLAELRRAPALEGRRVHSLIFTVDSGDGVPASSEASLLRTNLLALRADRGVKGDMKELAEADAIKSALYDEPRAERRVPTSLIWARMAEQGDSLFVPTPIIRKEYLPGGMTSQVGRLKVRNPRPIMELNEVIACSVAYRSRSYRWRARLQWTRYALHAGSGSFDKPWKFVMLPFAIPLYVLDSVRHRRLTP
jgi:glycosyltransferase involved in cell wall biosynthesis